MIVGEGLGMEAVLRRRAIPSAALLIGLWVATPSMAQDPTDHVEASGEALVQSPPPIPPPTLLDADPRVRRAEALLERVEVFDAGAARLARQLHRLHGESGECAASAAVARALELVVEASSAALDTTASGLAVLPDADGLEALRDRTTQAGARRAEARVGLRGLRDAQARACPDVVAKGPTAWVPELAATDTERIVVFARTEPGTVVWVGGHPAGAGDTDGWSALVIRSGEARLCVADAAAESCGSAVAVTATPFAAYDLTTLTD